MAANFDLSALAIKAICPNNEILYDDKNMPSIMVKIPKMSFKELGLGDSDETFPAFIVNGKEIDCFYVSKYQNIVVDGRAYSLPGEDPKTQIALDAAAKTCTDKGAGWHMMTRMEWAALAHWCKMNDTQPLGNNNYGKDTSETGYKAIPSMARDASGRIQRVATGTGPLTWSHDGTPSGIWDLNGNVTEWVTGMRTVYGELQILKDNDAADSGNSHASGSAQWMAIDGTTGELIAPDGTGTTENSIKADWISSKWKWITSEISNKEDASHNCTIENVSADDGICEKALNLLKALAMLKSDDTAGAYKGDNIYMNNGSAERAFYCGGHWTAGDAGVFYARGVTTRSNGSLTVVGFRSAFVTLETE